MTSTTLDAAVQQASAQARQVRFARVLLIVIAGFFFAIGWTAGRAWTGAVFCALMVRQGWREGTGAQATTPGQASSA